MPSSVLLSAVVGVPDVFQQIPLTDSLSRCNVNFFYNTFYFVADVIDGFFFAGVWSCVERADQKE